MKNYKLLLLMPFFFLLGSCVSLRGNDKAIYYAYLATGDYGNVKKVLDVYSVVNLRTRGGVSPLMVSAWFGYADVVELLLENGADIDARSYSGVNAMTLSIMASHVAAFKLLGATDTENEDDIGNIALSYAAQNENMIFLETLILQNEYLDISESARKSNNKSIRKSIGERINHKNDKGLTPLHLAVISNNFDAVVILLKAGADIDCLDDENASPLFIALALKQKRISDFLLNKGAKKYGKTDWNIEANDLIPKNN